MSDDTSKTRSDRNRISLSEDYEVRYWSEKFGVSRDELERAVKQVGPSPTAVQDYLRGHKGER